MTPSTLDPAGSQRQLLQRFGMAVVASSERLAEEMSQAFSSIDQHLQSPRLASWGVDCDWLLSGLQNTSRTALDLLACAGHCSQGESDSIQRRIMLNINQARVQAQAAGNSVAPIVAASRITSLVTRAKEDSAVIYNDLREARTREHGPRQRAQ
ncbi:hypothetical protein [Cupriavidus sp. TMH.W2]|uniref:hypothetical protein n=1 Tax=Cupriavidus sp. TMH.W2 TaxID=3434465 RepID=UPI003D77530D